MRAPSFLVNCLVITVGVGFLAFVSMFWGALDASHKPKSKPKPKHTATVAKPKKIVARSTPVQTPLPTPTPGTTLGSYAEIDKWAAAAPRSAEVDVHTLAQYLTRPARNDREKARAIYRWLAERISYDAPALQTRNYPDPSPQATLRTHLAVCEGYARLFKALADEAGLTCEMVTGHCKGYGFVSEFAESNSHAWNAVQIDGKWQLIDSTWGGGYLNSGKVYQRSFNEFYFFTPPEQLIYTHFPSESRWQFLSKPLEEKGFLGQPRLNSHFFQAGLHLVSPLGGQITARVPFRVVLRGSETLGILARLGDSETGALVSRKGDTFTIEVSPPATGDYSLRVFAGTPGTQMPQVLEFAVKALASGPPLPEEFPDFEQSQTSLTSPRSGQLSSSQPQQFDLDIPGAREVFVGSGEDRTTLLREGSHFHGVARLQPGTATVFAQFGENHYQGLLRYQVR